MNMLAAIDRPVDLNIAYQPIVSAETGLAYAWQAIAATADGRSFSRVAAAMPPERRAGLERRRIGLAIAGAVAAGLDRGDALLAIPVGAAGGSPEALLNHLFRMAVACRFPLEKLVVGVNVDERGDLLPAAALAQACADRGIAIAFDGFAAGPLAFRLFARFTPRFVRLDPALVRNIGASTSRRLIVEGVHRLARNLDVALVAVGLGGREDIARLHAIGVRHVQEDWIAPSLPPQVPRREARCTVPQHRRLAHHQRAAAPRPPLPAALQPAMLAALAC